MLRRFSGNSAIRLLALLVMGLLCGGCGDASDGPAPSPAEPTGVRDPELIIEAPGSPPSGMVWIPGGIFGQGSEGPDARADERPRHRVALNGFWMDTTEVTNRRFARFVAATGYVTVAERPIERAELARQVGEARAAEVPEADLRPGGSVFRTAIGWEFVTGASWRHPDGPGSDLEGKDDHPVVLVAYEDAVACLRFEGKRLPTEAEWEHAARGGLENAPFVWGQTPPSQGPARANIWQGRFPERDLGIDGFLGRAPVRSFPPNGYGLHDMAGNVWEWCADWYDPETYLQRAAKGLVHDPVGPERSRNPAEPGIPLRVLRGGSYLCAEGQCEGYRPSARMSSSPDSGLSHVGFRGVLTPAMRSGSGR